MAILNSIISIFTSKRLKSIENFKLKPVEVQLKQLENIVKKAVNTEYGKKYNFSSIKTYDDFKSNVPIVEYENIREDVMGMMNGKTNILWNEDVKWFAKSSGTTDSKSKFIPVSPSILENAHFRGGKDVVALFNKNYTDSNAFGGKTLALGGSSEVNSNNFNCRFGDLSAIMISNSPFWANMMKTPDSSIMLMSNWEEKLERICEATIKEDVRCLAGVPSWFLTLINKILDVTGKNNLHEVWPNLELFIHGGISFTPYREEYKRLLPDPKMKYMETYNASEGFFAMQDDLNDSAMLLMLDYDIFYEFIPMDSFREGKFECISIEDVKIGVNYAMIITTSGGLWRYMIGDTIEFTSTKPHKIKITGRTKLFINAFGEELIIDNAIEAIRTACNETNSEIFEFTAAPIFMDEGKKGAHEWVIEFITPPQSIERFGEIMDKRLMELNSDYEAKRILSLDIPKIHIAKKDLFNNWLKEKGKLGGQNKVPRLWNTRKHIEELLKMNE